MKKIVSAIRKQLQIGNRVVLCSILESEGSAPRHAGAKMAVFSDGTSVGTVGGGAVEKLAIGYALELLQEGRSGTKEYLLHPNGKEDIGMVCGGNVLLGFQCLLPEWQNDLEAIRDLEGVLESACSAWLKTEFPEEGEARMTLIRKEDIHSDQQRLPQQPVLERSPGKLSLIEPVSKQYMVYIFGGGHVCEALVPALAAVGFPVTVYDERPEFAQKSRFPMAKQVLLGSYDELLSKLQIRPEDYIVIMTPGHKADCSVLSQVLKTEATYIGCIGSEKKVAYVNGQLRALGYDDRDISRIHAPIGLPILAQTPEEIAVSITAQLIYHRHGGI